MAELFHAGFEVDLSEVTGTSASNATTAQSASAALNGTAGGVLLTRTANSPNALVFNDIVVTGATHTRTAWYTDLSSLTIGTNGDNTALLRQYVLSVQITSMVTVHRVSGALRFRLYLYNDSNVPTIVTSTFGLPSWLELRTVRASGVGVTDAEAQLYAGGGDYATTGELIAEVTGVALYTRFGQQDRILGGMHNALVQSASVGGSIKFDEWTLRNDDIPILYGVGAETSGRPYDLDQLLDLTTIRM